MLNVYSSIVQETREDLWGLSEKYLKFWAVLAQKEYRGSYEFTRAVFPRKKLLSSDLSMNEKARNDYVSSDRVLLENF